MRANLKRVLISAAILFLVLVAWLVASLCARQIWFPTQEPGQNGLAARFTGRSFSEILIIKNLKPDSLANRIPREAEQVRLVGVFNVVKPSLYGFLLESSSKFKLWVDGNLVITHKGRVEVGSRYLWLWPGRHLLEIELNREQPGLSLEMVLKWSKLRSGLSAITGKDIYPATNLLKRDAASNATYWSDASPALFLWLVLACSVWFLFNQWLGKDWWRWSKLKSQITRVQVSILVMVLIFMFAGSFRAYLNPRPGYEPQLRLSDSIPIWWQYNKDSPMELYSAAKFPFFFKVQKDRINRPLYPALVWAASGLVYVAARPFCALGLLDRTLPAYFIVKLMILLAFGVVGFSLFREFMGQIPALTAVGLMLSQRYAFDSLATVNTSETQFITPVFVAFFLLLLSRDYSNAKNVCFSIIIGLLLLARPNYSSYLAALLFGIFSCRYKESALSLVFVALPLLLWMLFLKMAGLEYYFASVQSYGNLSWFSLLFSFDSPLLIIKDLFSRTWAYLGSVFGNLWGGIAAFSLAYFITKGKADKKIVNGLLFYFSLSIIINFAQYLAVGAIYTRMSVDLLLWISGFAAYGLIEVLGGGSEARQKSIAFFVLLFSFSSTLLSALKLPWVNPLDQIK